MGPSEDLRVEIEVQRSRFLKLVAEVRPRLHRYCSRMLQSSLDGEDLVQETLARAFFHLPLVREPRDLGAWLFRVAHNLCIDELRRRARRERGPSFEPAESEGKPAEPGQAVEVESAFRRLLELLPPKERACLILKDVLEFPLKDIAGIVSSSEGAVKAALHRAREKIATDPRDVPPPTRKRGRATRELIERYAALFSARDWDGLIELIGADARLEVVDMYDASGVRSFSDRYLWNYDRIGFEWRARGRSDRRRTPGRRRTQRAGFVATGRRHSDRNRETVAFAGCAITCTCRATSSRASKKREHCRHRERGRCHRPRSRILSGLPTNPGWAARPDPGPRLR